MGRRTREPWIIADKLTVHNDATVDDLTVNDDATVTDDLAVGGHTSLQTVNLDPAATPPASPTTGDMWIEDDVLNLGSAHEGVIAQMPFELWVDVRNESGVDIYNGDAVYTIGNSGNRRLIALAKADSIATSCVLGLATHDIPDGNNGLVTTFGLVRDLNTIGGAEAWTEGQRLYLSPDTAGAYTDTAPSAPNELQPIGEVGRVHAHQGNIMVRVRAGSVILNGRYVIAGYGAINVDDGSNTQALTTTPAKLDLFVNNGVSLLTTPDATNDRVTVSVSGVYKVFHQSSFSFSVGNIVIEAHIYINQVEQPEGFHRKIGTAGDAGSASCAGLYNLTADDEIEVYYNTGSGSGNITVVDAQLIVERVG